MPQALTYDEAVAAARLAYDEDRLLAQHPFEKDGKLVYGYRVIDPTGRECRCAIGASLTEETLAEIDWRILHDKTIGYLIGDTLEVPEANIRLLDDLQSSHDEWLRGDDSAKELFLHLIGRG